MMKVLILGAKGLLGEALQKEFSALEVIAYDREELDVADFEKLRSEIKRISPNIIINCVAWNDVDGAEAEADRTQQGLEDRAMLLNCHVVRELAKISKSFNAILVTYSTDNVFSGRKEDGYTENEVLDPVNAYGRSKACGEAAVQDETDKFYLIRTSRLYGHKPRSSAAKTSFVLKMIELGEKNKELSVVDEEPGAFTYVKDLAQATKKLIEDKYPFGIYHLTANGAVTWYECAKEIFARLGKDITLKPVARKAFPRPAAVPAHSILINTKFPPLRDWREALADFLSDIYGRQ